MAMVSGTGVWGGGHLAEMASPGLGHGSSHEVGLERDHGDQGDYENDAQARAASVWTTPAPTADPASDLDSMIATAVDAALASGTTPAPTADPASDLDSMIRPHPPLTLRRALIP